MALVCLLEPGIHDGGVVTTSHGADILKGTVLCGWQDGFSKKVDSVLAQRGRRWRRS